MGKKQFLLKACLVAAFLSSSAMPVASVAAEFVWSPGEKTVFTVPLDEEGLEALEPDEVTQAKIGLWVPGDFDPAREWKILVVSTTWGGGTSSSAVAAMDGYLASAESVGGWIVMAADAATDPVTGDSFVLRWATLRAGLRAMEAQWPASGSWPVASGGFSGGAKRAGPLGAMILLYGHPLIGLWKGGCNEDYASRALDEFDDPEEFQNVPVFLSVGDSDDLVPPEYRQEVLDSLDLHGFTTVRQEIHAGGHSLYAPDVEEGLRWFDSLAGKKLRLSMHERTFTWAGAENQELEVAANVEWTAQSSVPWLTLGTSGGAGNGKVSWDVAANTETAARTGTITVSGGGLTRTCTVTQRAEGGPEVELVDGIDWTYTVSGGIASLGSGTSGGDRAVSRKTRAHLSIPSALGGHPVGEIGAYAFDSCGNLLSVAIPDGVTNIGAHAFYNCYGLTSLDIGDGVAKIGDYAFQYCQGLPSVTIPDGVETIGAYAFNECTDLTTVTIGAGATSIGAYAFNGCGDLTTLTIGDAVKTIGSYAFAGCYDLAAVTMGNGVETIGSHAFANCYGWTSLPIPDSVKDIRDYAFGWCRDVTTVTIGNGVTNIGDYAFFRCFALTTVTMGDSVAGIAGNSFADCDRLQTLYVPAPWEGTDMLEGVVLPEGCTVVYGIPERETVDGVTWFFETADGQATVTKAEPAEGRLTIPDALGGHPVTKIGDSAFGYCQALTDVTIGNRVTAIGSDVFYMCTGLTNVTMPGNVESIGYGAFAGCSGLADLAIGDGVASIGDYAFCNCTGLTNATVPDSVAFAGHSLFADCPGLASIEVPHHLRNATGDWELPEGCAITVRAPGPLAIATAGALPTALTEVRYSQPLKAVGGMEPYAWEVADGEKWPEWLDRETIRSWSEWGYDCPYLEGWPYEEHIGNYEFTLRVTDADGASAERTFTLAVEKNPNSPPVIDSWVPAADWFRLDPGETQAFSVEARDPDGDPLAYEWRVYDSEWNQVHQSESGDGGSGFSWPLDGGTTGTFRVEVTVTDGAFSQYREWNVRVEYPKTVYVDGGAGEEGADGTSQATAFPTLAAAAESALFGDTVLVAPGVYEAADEGFAGGVELRSRDGAAATVIDGVGKRPPVRGRDESGGIVVAGFTLRNGASEEWEPAAAPEGARLENCIVEGCTATESAGIVLRSELVNCAVAGNRYASALVSSCKLWNCTVAGNVCVGAGPALDENTAAWNSIAWGNCDPSGIECSTSRSSWTDEDGTPRFAYPSFTNCCVAAFEETAAMLAEEEIDIAEVASECFGADPQFVDLANGDVRLRPGSPCLDKGVAAWVQGETDALGNGRVQGEAADLGAYEGAVAGFVISVRVQGHGTVEPMTAVVPAGGSATFTATAAGARTFEGWAKDGVDAGSAATYTWSNVRADGELAARFNPAAFHVDAATGDDANDGLSWETPKATLQAAVEEALDGERVTVRPGTYGAIDAEGKAIVIESTAGAASTVIDGGGTARCAHLGARSGEGATLVGFTLRNGNASREGSYYESCGGGAYGGTLLDCVVSSNRAGIGGGGLNLVTAYRCRIVGNAVDGNGIDVFGGGAADSTLYNCLVAGNSVALALDGTDSDWASARGGGVAWCTLHQCTVADNSVAVAGDAAGIDVTAAGGGATSSIYQPGSIVFGNTVNGEVSDSDDGNEACLIGTDPLFVDRANGDYRLQSNSPAVDRGWTSVPQWRGEGAAAEGETDLEGNPRVRGLCIDLGCYESAWTAAEAGRTVVDGVEWWFAVEGGGATIVGGPTNLVGTIPGSLGGRPVKRIGDGAFSGIWFQTETTAIPDGVESIGDGGFEGCGSLERLVIPSSVTAIGRQAFAYCYALTTVDWGNGVTDIGDEAFCECSRLTSLTLPESVAHVGVDAFRACRDLTTLYVPASWEGTEMLADAGVPAGCAIVYGGSPAPESTYAAWAETHGVAGAWDATDANGIPNVFRYAFDVPSADFRILDLAFETGEDGKTRPVVKTPPLKNTAGFAFAVEVSAGLPDGFPDEFELDASGETGMEDPLPAGGIRFFRLRAEEAPAAASAGPAAAARRASARP